MSELQKLKQQYPSLVFDNDCLYIDNGTDIPLRDEDESKSVIEDHYNGWETEVPSSTGGDPREVVMQPVSGYQYIKEIYNGSHQDAFNDVV